MVILTAAEVVVFPAVSRATAVNTYVPSNVEAVPQPSTNGGDAIAAPIGAPFNWNCTLAIATLSDAPAESVLVPVTVESGAGAVIHTAGGVVSADCPNSGCPDDDASAEMMTKPAIGVRRVTIERQFARVAEWRNCMGPPELTAEAPGVRP